MCMCPCHRAEVPSHTCSRTPPSRLVRAYCPARRTRSRAIAREHARSKTKTPCGAWMGWLPLPAVARPQDSNLAHAQFKQQKHRNSAQFNAIQSNSEQFISIARVFNGTPLNTHDERSPTQNQGKRMHGTHMLVVKAAGSTAMDALARAPSRANTRRANKKTPCGAWMGWLPPPALARPQKSNPAHAQFKQHKHRNSAQFKAIQSNSEQFRSTARLSASLRGTHAMSVRQCKTNENSSTTRGCSS